MQPQAGDQYQPKWTHYHPQSTVWVLNPFDHVVTFQVADENNVQSTFSIKARERAELPGGPIATLGVKKIVDEMIQNSKHDVLSLYEAGTRARYEKKVVLRIKDAPRAVTTDPGVGESIDLSIGGGDEKEEEEVEKEAKPFEEVPKNPEYEKKAEKKPKIPVKLPKKNQVVEAE